MNFMGSLQNGIAIFISILLIVIELLLLYLASEVGGERLIVVSGPLRLCRY